MNNKKKILIIAFIVAFVIIAGVIVALILSNSGNSAETNEETGVVYSGELTYWGLWEPSSVMESVIEDYETLHPDVKINYVQKSFTNYEDNLYGILQEGDSSDVLVPDIFLIGNGWLPKYQKYLYALPSAIMTTSEYANLFYDTEVGDFTGSNGNIYAMAWGIDGLALFYNKELLEGAGYTSIPSDWDSFVEMAQALTKRNSSTGEITQAGLAIGTSENVLHSESILSFFFLLNGLDNADLMPSSTTIDLSSTKAQVALETYASFTDSETGTWSTSLKNDLELFYEGKLAFMLAPSWRAFDIIESAPSVEFGIAKIPQLPSNNPVYYSMYWGEAVSKYSENPGLAWDFITYLNTESVQKKLYSNASSVRAFGEPYSLKSLASLLTDENDDESVDLNGESYPSSIIEMAPYMKAWQMGDQYFVEDVLNEAITRVIEDDVDASQALKDAQDEINDQLAETNK